jgi:septum formation protein
MKLNRQLILASNSPRRKQILQDAGFEFIVKVKTTDESFSSQMSVYEVSSFLAQKKAMAFEGEISQTEILLTADTVVIVADQILNKPLDFEEAFDMLKLLSGKTHEVSTGFCLMIDNQYLTFADIAKVTFKDLTDQEINHYIKVCKPFDKAGSYGVQDFIGMIGITSILGSYFTVMGLPIHRVYEELSRVQVIHF